MSLPDEPQAAAEAQRAPGRSGLVRFLAQRPWARRAISVSSAGLLVVAVGLLGYPVYTNVYQGRVQSQLEREFASADLRDSYRQGTVAIGDSLTRIKIPAIGVDTIVVEGTSASALRAGAGHYPKTPLPCEEGNVGIAGHRTTYGKPFSNLDRLKPGDTITLETPVGSCSYRVERAPFIVVPSDLSVIAKLPGRLLTLTTCHPKNSAKQRLIVRAVMTATSPSQPA